MIRSKLNFEVSGATAEEVSTKGWKVISDYYQVSADQFTKDYDVDLTVTVLSAGEPEQVFVGVFLVKPKSYSYSQVRVVPA